MSGWPFRIAVLFCILFASSTAAEEYVLKHSTAFHTDFCDGAAVVDPRELDCTSETSGDFYGTGVRLGVYFSWIASWLANLCNPDEIAGALDANAIFLISLMVSLFYQTAQKSLPYIDALMLMQISAGYMFGCFSIWGYRTVHYREEGRQGDIDAYQCRSFG